MIKALSLGFVAAAISLGAAAQVSIPTRYGALTTNKDDALSFKGRVLAPEVTVPSSAYVIQTFAMQDSDVLLISQAGGSACPGQFTFVTLTSSVASVSPTFGTCHDDVSEPILQGQVISFTQPKVKGKGLVKFTYTAGAVYQDGKPVK